MIRQLEDMKRPWNVVIFLFLQLFDGQPMCRPCQIKHNNKHWFHCCHFGTHRAKQKKNGGVNPMVQHKYWILYLLLWYLYVLSVFTSYVHVILIKCRGKMGICLSRVNNYDQSASPGFSACGGGALFNFLYKNTVERRWSKSSFWGDFVNLLLSFAR